MSLDVPQDVLERAGRGEVDRATEYRVVKSSLPLAVAIVESAVDNWKPNRGLLVFDAKADDEARNQLLRLLASDAMRALMEKHLNVSLGFINCHFVVVSDHWAKSTHQWKEATSMRQQLLAQRPELIDC